MRSHRKLYSGQSCVQLKIWVLLLRKKRKVDIGNNKETLTQTSSHVMDFFTHKEKAPRKDFFLNLHVLTFGEMHGTAAVFSLQA